MEDALTEQRKIIAQQQNIPPEQVPQAQAQARLDAQPKLAETTIPDVSLQSSMSDQPPPPTLVGADIQRQNEFEANNIQLKSGEWVNRKTILAMPVEQQKLLYDLGIEKFLVKMRDSPPPRPLPEGITEQQFYQLVSNAASMRQTIKDYDPALQERVSPQTRITPETINSMQANVDYLDKLLKYYQDYQYNYFEKDFGQPPTKEDIETVLRGGNLESVFMFRELDKGTIGLTAEDITARQTTIVAAAQFHQDNVELLSGEYIAKEDWDKLSPDDQYYLRNNGIQAFNTYKAITPPPAPEAPIFDASNLGGVSLIAEPTINIEQEISPDMSALEEYKVYKISGRSGGIQYDIEGNQPNQEFEGYNIQAYLWDNKDKPAAALQALRDAGFTQEQISKAANANVKIAQSLQTAFAKAKPNDPLDWLNAAMGQYDNSTGLGKWIGDHYQEFTTWFDRNTPDIAPLERLNAFMKTPLGRFMMVAISGGMGAVSPVGGNLQNLFLQEGKIRSTLTDIKNIPTDDDVITMLAQKMRGVGVEGKGAGTLTDREIQDILTRIKGFTGGSLTNESYETLAKMTPQQIIQYKNEAELIKQGVFNIKDGTLWTREGKIYYGYQPEVGMELGVADTGGGVSPLRQINTAEKIDLSRVALKTEIEYYQTSGVRPSYTTLEALQSKLARMPLPSNSLYLNTFEKIAVASLPYIIAAKEQGVTDESVVEQLAQGTLSQAQPQGISITQTTLPATQTMPVINIKGTAQPPRIAIAITPVTSTALSAPIGIGSLTAPVPVGAIEVGTSIISVSAPQPTSYPQPIPQPQPQPMPQPQPQPQPAPYPQPKVIETGIGLPTKPPIETPPPIITKLPSDDEKKKTREEYEAEFAGNVCFPKGTSIIIKKLVKGHNISGDYTAEKLGVIQIEDIKIGQDVYSYNQANGVKETRKVVRVFKRESCSFVKVNFDNGNSLTCTPEHPFAVITIDSKITWVEVNKLKVGDNCLQLSYNGVGTFKTAGKTWDELYGSAKADIMRRNKAGIEKGNKKHCNPQTVSKQSKERMARVGNDYWVGRKHRDSSRLKMSNSKIGKFTHKPSDSERAILSKKALERWANDESYREKVLKGVFKGLNTKPNWAELYLSNILEEVCPSEFKYNGDIKSGFIFGTRIPDFVNVNGKKKIIELFGCDWHCCPSCLKTQTPMGVSCDKQHADDIKRFKTYTKLGWDTLVIWSHELKDVPNLKNKIKSFVYNPNTKLIKVLSIEPIDYEYPSDVYNIEVENNNNYFAKGILVHNCWKQGFGWWSIKPPYKTKEDRHFFYGQEPPQGMIAVEGGVGAAYRSIQASGGEIPDDFAMDLGIMDIKISKPTNAPGAAGSITYTEDLTQSKRLDRQSFSEAEKQTQARRTDAVSARNMGYNEPDYVDTGDRYYLGHRLPDNIEASI